MQAKDILLAVCDKLESMVEELYQPVNHDSEVGLMNLYNGIQNVKNMDGVLEIGSLAEVLRNLEVFDWKGYNKQTINLLAMFLDFLFDTMNQEAWETEIIDADQYNIYDTEETQGIGNIFYSSTDDISNEMILLNCNNTYQIGEFLQRIGNIQEMVVKTIWLIDLKYQYQSMFVAKENMDAQKRKSKVEYLKMCAVLNGETFHITPSISRHQVMLPVRYQDAIEYSQYSEIIDVMNEFNAQSHIIDKYVKIYQVVENFMFKKLICDLCSTRNYEKLTLRDFKGISETLQKSEKDALYSFIDRAMQVVVDGKSFEERLKEEWKNNFLLPNKLSVAEKFIRMLAITNKDGNYKSVSNIENNPNNQLVRIFCDMIYATRCSIVHNKVNEYHITYMNLDGDIKWVMESFLMPIMEDLSYGLMLNSNNVVMYRQNCLSLY